MGYSIAQLDSTTWELRAADGSPLGTFASADGRRGYDVALQALGGIITGELAAALDAMPADAESADGLLPEGWTSPALALSEKLPGGRDFTDVAWSWRDPAASLVPLMFQSKNAGHYDADLVGFFTEIANASGTVTARGRFYDSEAGQAARDVLLDDRPFGVSVDPTEAVEAEYDFVCTEWTDDGFECLAAEETVKFLAYEIGGATMHPFQGFDKAQVLLDPNPAAASVAPVRASAPSTRPKRALLQLAPPQPGVEFLPGVMGEDVLVEQTDREGNVLGFAVPLTIGEPDEDGYRYGYAHLSYWSQCHTGEPWGPGICASAQPSKTGYRDFHAGEVLCDDGTRVPTGRLVVGCEHSDAFDVQGVRDHLAQAGMGWASAHVVDDTHGPWISFVLEPNLSESQVRMLRSLSLSGEWVGELGGILSVNASGLPVQREKIAASFGPPMAVREDGSPRFVIPQAALRASVRGGHVAKLVGGNMVKSCPECAKRRLARGITDGAPAVNEAVLSMLRTLDLRTRHLVPAAAEAARATIAAS